MHADPRPPLREPPALRHPRRHRRAGFTVIEILAVTAMLGAMAVILVPKIQESIEKAKVARAAGDLRALQQDVDGQDSLPASLGVIGRASVIDPWGRPYVYVPFPGGPPAGGALLDRFGVPLNRRYDLYSAGKDGIPANGDDVVRANDGTYLGLRSRF